MASRNWSVRARQILPWANILNLIAIPIIIGIIGNGYTNSIKQKEIEGKYVEISVGILSQEPSESNKDTRKWAIDVINKYSGVPMGKGAQKELQNSVIYGTHKCTGEDNCTSCVNCKYCEFCSKKDGKCGVCENKETTETKVE